jgi:polar amino acid transport system substrate-binding protein
LMDFGPPYLLIELGYLVQAASGIAASADIDRAGIRVGAAAGSTSEKTLAQMLTNAKVVSVPTNQAGAEHVSAGEIGAFATNKATLFELSARLPGLRVLPERWGEERHAIAIPKGRAEGLAFITSFTADVLKRGLVRDAMERAGLRGAVPANAT